MKTIKTLTIGLFMAAMGSTAMAQYPDWGCSEEVQQQMLEPVSLYQDAIAQFKSTKDSRWLEEAYPYWKQIVANCPKQSKNLYNNGANIMRVMIAKAKDQAERDAYVDELMHMYDVRIATYGEGPKWTAKKAMDLQEILKNDGLERYYTLYDQAVKMEGDLEAGYLVKYMEATIDYVRSGKAEPTLVVDNYDIASEKLDAELEKNIDDSVKAATIRGYIAGVEAAFSPYATCDQLVEIYGKKFEADPENIDLLKKITGILKKKRCIDQPLFFSATENLYLALGITATLLGIVFWMNGHVLAFVMPLIYLLLHVYTWQKMRCINHGRQLNECLGETARNIFIYGLCVALGLMLI